MKISVTGFPENCQKSVRTILFLHVLLGASAHAQIYADFTVSHGSNPLGTFTVTLEHIKAPRTTANFIGLATGKRPWIDVKTGAVRTNTPFYDGLTFHRLDHDFVIQGGSPDGTGADGPGYSILDEFDRSLVHTSDFVISMAKTAPPNTGGSQFFITLGNSSFLDLKHSVFGRVTAGLHIVEAFRDQSAFPTGTGEKPLVPVTIDSVVIRGPDAAAFDINAPSHRLPEVGGTVFTPALDTTTNEFTLGFDRAPKTDYLFLESRDLVSWVSLANFISLDASPGFVLSFGTETSPPYFANVATVNYATSPEAPGDLVSAGRILRISNPDETSLELTLAPGAGTWRHLSASGAPLASGSLSNTTWVDDAPSTGSSISSVNLAYLITIGTLSLNFDAPAGPDSLTSLNAYLSFHTETSGWIQERSGAMTRYAFEILSN